MSSKAQNGQTAQPEPFFKVPKWLLASKTLSLPAKVLLVMLANYESLGTNSQCNPRHATLARETALSMATVKRALADLIRCRIIEVTRGQHGNSFRLAPRSEWRGILIAQFDLSETDPDSSKRAIEELNLSYLEPAVLITDEELLRKKRKHSLSHRNRTAKTGISPTKKPSAESVSLALQRSLIPEPEPVTALVVSTPQAETFEAWFEEKFWPFYPRKVGKAAALTAARRFAGKSATMRDEILAGLYRQLPNLESREPEFVPHAATWLNQKRWYDEPERARRPKETAHERGFRIAAADFMKEPSR